ncbi:uncharacterized protein [Dysidea avara]|uniref:uncharacterized protein isoform X2 n=1 Tax=Dysidea avara TaxID=196820 RepID=UPI00332154F5
MMGNEFAGTINKVSVAHKCCIQTLFHQLADDYIQARMPILADVNDGGLEKWGKSLNGLTDFKNKRARHFDIHRPGTRIKYCIQDKLVQEKTVLGLDLSVTSGGIGSLPLSDDLPGPSGLQSTLSSSTSGSQALQDIMPIMGTGEVTKSLNRAHQVQRGSVL